MTCRHISPYLYKCYVLSKPRDAFAVRRKMIKERRKREGLDLFLLLGFYQRSFHKMYINLHRRLDQYQMQIFPQVFIMSITVNKSYNYKGTEKIKSQCWFILCLSLVTLSRRPAKAAEMPLEDFLISLNNRTQWVEPLGTIIRYESMKTPHLLLCTAVAMLDVLFGGGEQPERSHLASHTGGCLLLCEYRNSRIRKAYPSDQVEGGAVSLKWCFRRMKTWNMWMMWDCSTVLLILPGFFHILSKAVFFVFLNLQKRENKDF